MKRGDVVLARMPQASGQRGKKRPAVVIQADRYAGTIQTIVVAGMTSNMALANDPSCLLIDVNTPEGAAAGLQKTSVVSGLILFTIPRALVEKTLGTLTPASLQKLDACVRTALEL